MVKHPSFAIILTQKSYWNDKMCCYSFKKPLSHGFGSLVPVTLAGLAGVKSLRVVGLCLSTAGCVQDAPSATPALRAHPVWNRNSLAEELWGKSERWNPAHSQIRILPWKVWEARKMTHHIGTAESDVLPVAQRGFWEVHKAEISEESSLGR